MKNQDSPARTASRINARSVVELPTCRTMPVMGLGTWELTDHTSETVVRALQLGYRMIDTACDYGSQPGIGQALRCGVIDRRSVYLVAKVEESGDAYAATRQYLGEIGVEYANLILIHRPPQEGVGVALWRGLQKARSEGLARDIGVSNYSIDQIQRLGRETGELPAVNQIEWSPFGHSDVMLEFCRRNRIVLQAYSPLTRATRLDDKRLASIAESHRRTPAQILIRWNLQRGTVPVPKANREEHLQENFAVFDFALGTEDMSALNGLNEHYSALGKLPYV